MKKVILVLDIVLILLAVSVIVCVGLGHELSPLGSIFVLLAYIASALNVTMRDYWDFKEAQNE